MSDHGGSGDRAEELNRVGRLSPVRATEIVTSMLTKERVDPVGTKISDTVLAIPGQDHRVRENDLALVDAALEVA